MPLELEEKDINKFILIGDRVLIKPRTKNDRTKTGLYLPAGVYEKEPIQCGYIIKAGPGYPIPAITDEIEPWKERGEEIKYVPLQVKPGDLAIYLQNHAHEVMYKDELYIILPHSSILMIIRDSEIFK